MLIENISLWCWKGHLHPRKQETETETETDPQSFKRRLCMTVKWAKVHWTDVIFRHNQLTSLKASHVPNME